MKADNEAQALMLAVAILKLGSLEEQAATGESIGATLEGLGIYDAVDVLLKITGYLTGGLYALIEARPDLKPVIDQYRENLAMRGFQDSL